jgi:hypothetical protein
MDQVFKEFAGRFNGKTSPVHLFWHSFDLAVTTVQLVWSIGAREQTAVGGCPNGGMQ